MVEISTYLGCQDLVSYKEANNSLNDFFISITDEGSLDVISSSRTKNKGHYLNGVIIIKINDMDLTSFSDWDDLDLLWTGLLNMVYDYLQDGEFGATQLSNNGLEWSIRKVPAKPKDLILFHAKKPNAVMDVNMDVFAVSEMKATSIEEEFLREVMSSAEEFLHIREIDTRLQNLLEFKDKYRKIKDLISE